MFLLIIPEKDHLIVVIILPVEQNASLTLGDVAIGLDFDPHGEGVARDVKEVAGGAPADGIGRPSAL